MFARKINIIIIASIYWSMPQRSHATLTSRLSGHLDGSFFCINKILIFIVFFSFRLFRILWIWIQITLMRFASYKRATDLSVMKSWICPESILRTIKVNVILPKWKKNLKAKSLFNVVDRFPKTLHHLN